MQEWLDSLRPSDASALVWIAWLLIFAVLVAPYVWWKLKPKKFKHRIGRKR